MIHPHYASAEARRDRKSARSLRSSFAVEQVTGAPLVIAESPVVVAVGDDAGEPA